MFRLFRMFFPWLHRDGGVLHATDNVIMTSSEKHHFAIVRGRRIVQDIPYLIPKDAEDSDRLNFQHYMLKVALQGLYGAPLKSPSTILDVATGTGQWAIEMAHVFPRATVTGFDYIAPMPDDSKSQSYEPGSRPANYTFIQGNMFDRLPFPSDSFDFTHMRLVYAATPMDVWPTLVAELLRVTKPGGYVELVEGFIPIDTGPTTAAIIGAIIETSHRRNIDLTLGKNIGAMLVKAGMYEVKERTLYIPIGKKHGRVGNLCEKDMLSVYKAIGANVVDVGVMDAEEWNRLFTQISGELEETVTLWPVFQAFGKKSVPIQR